VFTEQRKIVWKYSKNMLVIWKKSGIMRPMFASRPPFRVKSYRLEAQRIKGHTASRRKARGVPHVLVSAEPVLSEVERIQPNSVNYKANINYQNFNDQNGQAERILLRIKLRRTGRRKK